MMQGNNGFATSNYKFPPQMECNPISTEPKFPNNVNLPVQYLEDHWQNTLVKGDQEKKIELLWTHGENSGRRTGQNISTKSPELHGDKDETLPETDVGEIGGAGYNEQALKCAQKRDT